MEMNRGRTFERVWCVHAIHVATVSWHSSNCISLEKEKGNF